jgi:pilus assembly protein CpaB
MAIKLPALPLQLFRTTVLRVLPIVFAVIFGMTALLMTKRLIATERQKLAQERQQLVQERELLYADYKDPLEVFVAIKDIAPGDVIESSHLGLARIPEKFLQPYAVRAPQDVLGLVAVAPIAEGEQLLSNKFRRQEEMPRDATLADRTPKGRRAITIASDILAGVGGFVRPGDNIDILWTIQLPSGDGGQQPVTLTLFQDVPVLAIAGGGEGGGGFTVTLALDPQQTSFLLFAREQGRIQLSLRSRNESGEVAVAPANINTLMESVLGPQEVRPVSESHQVEVYKGLQKDVVVIADEVGPSR